MTYIKGADLIPSGMTFQKLALTAKKSCPHEESAEQL